MDYGSTAEIDHSVMGRKFSRLSLEADEFMRMRLSESSLAGVDIEFVYCPILMHERYRIGYPSKSFYSKKKRILTCNPQLDYDSYIAGDFEARRRIYLEGLLSASDLLKKAGVSEAQIQEFTAIVESLISQN